ncbi:MAG: hypothetical protein K8F25_04345, partial [Fimbriimonadaceae bacterium]|nr:hypothetical protein [Alphaproteobacteria bacterium]
LNLADDFGKTRISIYVMNVAYPMVPDEILNFCAGKKSVLMVEEGYPNYLEQALNDLLRRSEMEDGDIEVRTHIYGKGTLPNVGELKPAEILLGLSKFIAAASSADLDNTLVASISNDYIGNLESAAAAVNIPLPTRPPGFCTGCPERPLFSAIKLLEKELGPTHVCGDIGCNIFGSLEPFNTIQHTMCYGLSLSSASGIAPNFGKRVMTIMGDGGFWHNGLTSGVANAVYNGDDGVLVIVDNGYAAATGHHVIPSSGVNAAGQKVDMSIENALRGVGVTWVKTVYNYDVDELVDVLREALTTSEGGIKTIIGNAECMLAKQRRVKSQFTDGLVKGERVMRTRFGIDEDVCTGDHRCIRLSGCPSLTLRDNPNPLIPDPVAHIDNSCVGCGNCGAVVHEAGLCPSFFKVDVVTNPSRWERAMEGFRSAVIGALQGGRLV